MPSRPAPLPRPTIPRSSATGTTSASRASTSNTVVTQTNLDIPESLIRYSFYATPGAGASATALNRPGVAAATDIPAIYRGSVVAIALSGTASISAGNLVLTVRKGGTPLTVPAGTCQLTWSSGDYAIARFPKGDYGFERDDQLDVTFTTTSDYSPTSTVIDVSLMITQDSSEI